MTLTRLTHIYFIDNSQHNPLHYTYIICWDKYTVNIIHLLICIESFLSLLQNLLINNYTRDKLLNIKTNFLNKCLFNSRKKKLFKLSKTITVAKRVTELSFFVRRLITPY